MSVSEMYESARSCVNHLVLVADLPVFHNIPNMRSEEWYDA